MFTLVVTVPLSVALVVSLWLVRRYWMIPVPVLGYTCALAVYIVVDRRKRKERS